MKLRCHRCVVDLGTKFHDKISCSPQAVVHFMIVLDVSTPNFGGLYCAHSTLAAFIILMYLIEE